MSKQIIRVRASGPLAGEFPVGGAKNAALPQLCAAMLTDEPVYLNHCPDLADITTLSQLLTQHGVSIDATQLGGHHEPSRLTLHAQEITNLTAPYELVSNMRASILVLGPLLARMHSARVSLPGGCAIGARPVDLHLKGLEALGAQIELENGYVVATAPGGLKGATFEFPFVSVGATENLLLAATLAQGTTVLKNAAVEPEITDLANLLVKMGAHIDGIGTHQLTIAGVPRLGGATHHVVPDRIVAGTMALMVGITGGELVLRNARLEHLEALQNLMEPSGLIMTQLSSGLHVTRISDRLEAVEATTMPYPDFPTDLQAQLMAVMCTANGTSNVHEHIFENRFMHVPEFQRMGADINIKARQAIITGVPQLAGAPVKATDLRAAVAMIMAGMGASGETHITELHHLDRGYENIEQHLRAVGADIERLSA